MASFAVSAAAKSAAGVGGLDIVYARVGILTVPIYNSLASLTPEAINCLFGFSDARRSTMSLATMALLRSNRTQSGVIGHLVNGTFSPDSMAGSSLASDIRRKIVTLAGPSGL